MSPESLSAVRSLRAPSASSPKLDSILQKFGSISPRLPKPWPGLRLFSASARDLQPSAPPLCWQLPFTRCTSLRASAGHGIREAMNIPYFGRLLVSLLPWRRGKRSLRQAVFQQSFAPRSGRSSCDHRSDVARVAEERHLSDVRFESEGDVAALSGHVCLTCER